MNNSLEQFRTTFGCMRWCRLRLLVDVMISNGMKVHRVLIFSKLKNDAVFKAYRKGKKSRELSFQFVRLEFRIEGILPKQHLVLFRDCLNVPRKPLVLSGELWAVEDLHNRRLPQISQGMKGLTFAGSKVFAALFQFVQEFAFLPIAEEFTEEFARAREVAFANGLLDRFGHFGGEGDVDDCSHRRAKICNNMYYTLYHTEITCQEKPEPTLWVKRSGTAYTLLYDVIGQAYR